MIWYLLDTNHLSEAIRPVSAIRTRLRKERLAGHVFGTCVPALGELETGIQQTVAVPSHGFGVAQQRHGLRCGAHTSA